jgi:protein arginine kinase
MKLEQIYKHVGAWLEGTGPQGDVVISSRVRLARNIAGFNFFSHADDGEQADILHFVHDKLMTTPLKKQLWYLEMKETESLEKQLLTERHLISKELSAGDGARAVALTHDEALALMINEEDHLRIQAMTSGLQLNQMYQRVTEVDDPGLKTTGEIERVFRAAKDMRLAVRGLYGEGSDPIGDFFQLSNQTTLGKSEEQIIDELATQAVEPIIEYERRARQKLLEDKLVSLDDKIFRARGIMENARLISSEETLYMLSYIRLGIHLNRIKNINLKTVNRLFLLTQPAHLQNIFQETLDASARDRARAEFIRKELTNGGPIK